MSARTRLLIACGLALFAESAAVAQQSGNSLSSLATTPPVQQSVRYVDKKPDITDFRGLGQHLIYFPAFGLPTSVENLRTDCGDLDGDLTGPSSANRQGCIEDTPDFENFKHNLGWETIDQTFSRDAGPINGSAPIGVKAAGGHSDWAVLTIPTDSSDVSIGTTGLSGTIYDSYACENSSDTVNQIRINTGNLHEFCLNVIVDNTGNSSRFRPDAMLEARSDFASAKLVSAQDSNKKNENGEPIPWPEEFSFDGSPDMYTFRYMGMREGDRIRIRLKNENPEGNQCTGAGFGGIMVSHISTCTPEPGTCTPECGGRVCGDDGCGGSCGVCPRADKLVERVGVTDVEIPQAGGGAPLTNHAVGIETALILNSAFSDLVDRMEKEVREELKKEIRSQLHNGLQIRNFHAKVRDEFTITQTKGSTPEALTRIVYTFPNIHASFKLKDPGDPFHILKWSVDIDIRDITLSADYDNAGNVILPFEMDIGTFETDVEDQGIAILLGPIALPFVHLGMATVLGPLSPIAEPLLPLLSAVPPLVNLTVLGAPEIFGLAVDIILTQKLWEKLHEALPEITQDKLTKITVPSLAVVPKQIQIGGVDYATPFRNAILNRPPGSVITIHYDGTSPQLLSGTNPVKTTLRSTVTLDMWNSWKATAGALETVFPEIIGNIDPPYLNSAGQYTVDGWVCSEGLGMSLDTGVFVDGFAKKLTRADLPSDITIAHACDTYSYDAYRYSMSMTGSEMSGVNAWDNKVTVQAGLSVAGPAGPIAFEKGMGEVSRAAAKLWLSDDAPPNDSHFNPGSEHIGDFNGDLKDDYMWFRNGWWVALANPTGDGFNPPSIWLASNAVPNNEAYHTGFEFIADFNGDGRDDYMWFRNGWRVALANAYGTGFLPPALWLADNAPPSFQHWNGTSQHVGDFNYDDRADYMWYRNGDGWYVALAKADATGFWQPTRWLASSAAPGTGTDGGSFEFVGDFSGDGRDDYLWWSSGSGGWRVAVANNTGTGFGTPGLWLPDASPPNLGQFGHTNSNSQHVADFNGDGRMDYMWYKGPASEGPIGDGTDGWWVALTNYMGTGFMAPVLWLSAKAVPNVESYHTGFEFIGDFNNDMKDDFMWFRNGWRVALADSTGTGFRPPVLWLDADLLPGIPVYSNHGSQHIGDFNGDGSADYLWYHEVTGSSASSGVRVARTLLSPPPPIGGGC